MDIVTCLRVQKLPKEGKAQPSAKATVHIFRRGSDLTLCGRKVKKGDARWVVKRNASEADVTCRRCKEKEAAVAAEAAAPKVAKPSRAAQRVAAESAARPARTRSKKITRVPVEQEEYPEMGAAFVEG